MGLFELDFMQKLDATVWPHLCEQWPDADWGVYERMRLKTGAHCAPCWWHALLAELGEYGDDGTRRMAERVMSISVPNLCGGP